ncbi:MAG: flagellar assembly protein FliX [Pseudomonadota bacterium]
MRVSQTRRSNAAQSGRAGRGAASRGGDFQLPNARKTAGRRKVSGPSQISSIDTIVALQAVDDASDRRRQAVETGDRILDLLDRLKVGLLSGSISTSDLARLKKTIEKQQSVEGDPELNEVLRQIDLRARVELAKLKRDAA